MEEKWMPVVDYEGLYEISNFGNVRAVERYYYTGTGTKVKRRIYSTVKAVSINTHGYPQSIFTKNGNRKKITIHRLVALAFIANPENKSQVNHKDGDKLNNCVENLEWATAAENMAHASAAGLLTPVPESDGEKIVIYFEGDKCLGASTAITELAKRLNLDRSSVYRAARGKQKGTGGFSFRYSTIEEYAQIVATAHMQPMVEAKNSMDNALRIIMDNESASTEIYHIAKNGLRGIYPETPFDMQSMVDIIKELDDNSPAYEAQLSTMWGYVSAVKDALKLLLNEMAPALSTHKNTQK